MRMLALIFMLFTMCSCRGNLESGYNEKMAKLFHSCREKMDESYGKLLEGEYDVDKSDYSYHMKLNEARALSSYIKGIKCEASQLKYSKTAESFHIATIGYMTEIVDGYGVLLIKYIDEQKKGTRKSLLREITDEKEKIAALAESCLGHQIAFLNRAGIKVDSQKGK
ncbi:hypothetical protein K2F45_08855 [Sphingobacterium siyangense]|uniref:hypothetical protein n=1 Tax=Sphingobacterium TaxID=28453 RepID=UPI00200E02F7|nr:MULTISPECIES: hypothetical protein [Sphingobacterium]UQA77066.1 hypothetical protein K2F45_08855 [Sphingobacterium siyangense]